MNVARISSKSGNLLDSRTENHPTGWSRIEMDGPTKIGLDVPIAGATMALRGVTSDCAAPTGSGGLGFSGVWVRGLCLSRPRVNFRLLTGSSISEDWKEN